MSNDNFSYMNTQESDDILVKTFLTRVFTWMCAALAISGLVAWVFGTQAELTSLLFTQTLRGYAPTILGFAAMFSPLIFIFAINLGLQKFSLPVLLGLFIAFSIAMGMSLSSIFFQYHLGVIFKAFFISAGAFGLMAFLGATTKTDLTKMGSYLMIGLFGIIIASVINWFTHSSGLYFLIDIGAVVIFTGLASYQTQMLKTMALSMGSAGSENAQKMALSGALSLYLTFINLFMALLRLTGDRR